MAVNFPTIPPDICYTGNPVVYAFTFSSMNVNWKLDVCIVDASANTIVQLFPFPAESGTIRCDISNILHAKFSYPAPPSDTATDGSLPVNYFNSFKVQWRVIKPGVTPGAYTEETSIHYAIKGGIGMLDSQNSTRVNNYFYYAAGSFLPKVRSSNDLDGHFMTNMFRDLSRSLQPDEKCWILYMNRYAGSIKIQYYVNYIDGNYLIIDKYPTTAGSWNLSAWWVPVGINQCYLDPTGKGISDYSVTVTSSNGVTELTAINVFPDYRSDYRGMCLYWRNSVGGMDHIKLRGTREMSITSDAKSYDLPIDLASNSSQMDGLNRQYDGKMRPQWKGNTGFISQNMAIGLMDMLTKKGAWILSNNNWVPVQITSTEVKAYNTEDKLRNIEIQFQAANNFSFFPSRLFDSL